MIVKELIARLEKIKNKDKVCIITDSSGWCNIEKVSEVMAQVHIEQELNPIFSDN